MNCLDKILLDDAKATALPCNSAIFLLTMVYGFGVAFPLLWYCQFDVSPVNYSDSDENTNTKFIYIDVSIMFYLFSYTFTWLPGCVQFGMSVCMEIFNSSHVS